MDNNKVLNEYENHLWRVSEKLTENQKKNLMKIMGVMKTGSKIDKEEFKEEEREIENALRIIEKNNNQMDLLENCLFILYFY